MESFGHLRGARLRSSPFAAVDVKRREDVASPPAHERVGKPELLALQNEITIQRERLDRWCYEWADANREVLEESDASSSLVDTVSTVMKHISEVLDEADRLQSGDELSPAADGLGFGDRKTKIYGVRTDLRWTAEDRTKLESLATDLKNSTDLLFELSSVRKRLHDGTYPTPGKGKAGAATPPVSEKSLFMTRSYNTSEETLVNNPSRTSTSKTASSLVIPERLDPAMLDLPAEEPPPYDTVGATQSSRMVGFLRSASERGVDTGGFPVLVEYAPFDPAYRVTDVPVPQERLTLLLNYLARAAALADYSAYCSLPCIGFFEDPKEPRFGLVFKLPDFAVGDDSRRSKKEDYMPVSLLKLLQQASRNLNGNDRRLVAVGPSLEDRFRMAFNILQAFSRMHLEEGLMHKDVNSGNIIFFKSAKNSTSGDDADKSQYDLRTPYVSSFDLFSEHSLEKLSTEPKRNIYRHPEDPRTIKESCNKCKTPQCKCSKARFDLYGLALLLLEIGLWVPIADVFKDRYTVADFRQRIERIHVAKLPSKCGSIYSNVVKDLLEASNKDLSEDELRSSYTKWISKLKKCLLIDEKHDSSPSPELSPAASFGGLGVARQETPTQPRVTQSASRFALGGSFASLHHIPTAISSFMSNNPFSKNSPRRTPLPFAIREEGSEQWPFSTEDSIHGSESGLAVSQSTCRDPDSLSITSMTNTYHHAAQVIQRAWRARGRRPSFVEYRRKVTTIQKLWRRRQERRSSQSLSDTQRNVNMQERTIDQNTLITISHQQLPPRPKLRIHPMKMQPEVLDTWHHALLPRLERIVDRALRDSDETVSIDLLSLGETALSAKPTIFVTCSSIAKVKHALHRKLQYDPSVFDLKVRRGKIRRSKVTRSRRTPPPHRSMANEAFSDADVAPLNPYHQQRPLCGASIGAFVGNRHLPPVSYGGVINVDGETYGMTVHHLLDAPSDDDDSDYGDDTVAGASRSSARMKDNNPWLAGMAGHPTLQSVPTDSMFPLEISDDDCEFESSDEANFSGDDGYCSSEDEGDDRHSFKTVDTDGTQGDLTGVHPGVGGEIAITQPALDDVDDDFFPCMEDRDDDHLDSHRLGYIHASSGIRRWNRNGINHEIDWALLKLNPERLQPFNLIQGGKRFFRDAGKVFHPTLVEPVCRGTSYRAEEDEYPNQVARADELGNLTVHCIGRTSGLQGGVIGCAMSSVRIYHRRSFSRSWHVVGDFGVGGDSGAWVLDNTSGAVCGHVLAWCDRNAIAYICPMQVLLEDIKRTLGARRICLPGGNDIAELADSRRAGLVIEGVPISAASTPNGALRAGGTPRDQAKVGDKVDELVADIATTGKMDFAEKCDEAFRSGKYVGAAGGRPLDLRLGQLA